MSEEKENSCGPECAQIAKKRFGILQTGSLQDSGIKKFVSDPKSFNAERQMLQVGAIAFVIIVATMAALYFGYFKTIPNFAAKYGMYMIYAAISVTVIGIGVWHIKAYRHTFNCSMGMMVGMTIGMMAGFLLGAIVGATNGMFMGSVFGMFTGMFIGAWSARTCGIMSIMEGLMAGLMGGLMGAMTTVMMLNDNLMIFMPLLVGSIAVIMGGMSVMIYKEQSSLRSRRPEGSSQIYKESVDHRNTIPKNDIYDKLAFISLLFMLAMLTVLIMVYGPKSALLAVY